MNLFLQHPRSDVLASAMVAFGMLGSPRVFPWTALLIAAWFWLEGQPAAAVLLVGVAAVTKLLIRWLKFLFKRPRPAFSALSDSFPSGHAMAAIAVYGTAADVAARMHPLVAPLLIVAVCVLAIIIGASRIMLGTHWLTDVLAGMAFGLVIFTLAAIGLNHLY